MRHLLITSDFDDTIAQTSLIVPIANNCYDFRRCAQPITQAKLNKQLLEWLSTQRTREDAVLDGIHLVTNRSARAVVERFLDDQNIECFSSLHTNPSKASLVDVASYDTEEATLPWKGQRILALVNNSLKLMSDEDVLEFWMYDDNAALLKYVEDHLREVPRLEARFMLPPSFDC